MDVLLALERTPCVLLQKTKLMYGAHSDASQAVIACINAPSARNILCDVNMFPCLNPDRDGGRVVYGWVVLLLLIHLGLLSFLNED